MFKIYSGFCFQSKNRIEIKTIIVIHNIENKMIGNEKLIVGEGLGSKRVAKGALFV